VDVVDACTENDGRFTGEREVFFSNLDFGFLVGAFSG
jgi:hypothetical protein